MDVISFKECNTIYAKNQPEYQQLPAHRSKAGIVTSCWKLTIAERVKLLFTGKVYVKLMTFNSKLQPQKLSVTKDISN